MKCIVKSEKDIVSQVKNFQTNHNCLCSIEGQRFTDNWNHIQSTFSISSMESLEFAKAHFPPQRKAWCSGEQLLCQTESEQTQRKKNIVFISTPNPDSLTYFLHKRSVEKKSIQTFNVNGKKVYRLTNLRQWHL